MAWFRFKNQTRLIHKENMLPFWQPTAFSSSLLQGNLFPSFCLLSLCLSLPLFSQLNAKYVIFMVSSESCGWSPGTMLQASCVIQLSFLCFSKRKGRLSKDREFGRLTPQQIPAPQAEPYIVIARLPHKNPLKLADI